MRYDSPKTHTSTNTIRFLPSSTRSFAELISNTRRKHQKDIKPSEKSESISICIRFWDSYHIISIIKTSLKSYENDIDGDTSVKRKKSMECTKNKGIVDRGKMKSWDENSMQMQCNSMLICRETKGLVGFSFGDSENVFTRGWVRPRCYKIQNAGRTFL